MTQIDFLEKRKRFIELAQKKATGTPNELAAKFNIQERVLYRFLNSLKRDGLEFKYCRTKGSYYLDEDMEMPHQ
jgi:predicted DNA-binding transcriptional regulator YafY